MPKLIMEGTASFEFEDCKMAMLAAIEGPGTTFVRLQSWDEAKEHALLQPFVGQRVRVTVETI